MFTDRPFGGNPLAVFLEGGGLTADQMQTMAAELNLSESAFLGPQGSDGAWPLRIFTPKTELPFAGHPTVGTALAMAHAGRVAGVGEDSSRVVFAEGVGPVDTAIDWDGPRARRATLTVRGEPEFRPAPEGLAGLIRLMPPDISLAGARGAEPVQVSLGVPFTLVPLRSADALARATLDLQLWRDVLAESWAPHLYLFTDDTSDADFQARMFAPAMGIAEDPATGAAASDLAACLDSLHGAGGRWTIAQGVEMGRPSRLEIALKRLDDGQVAVDVGGGAVVVGRGSLLVPPA